MTRDERNERRTARAEHLLKQTVACVGQLVIADEMPAATQRAWMDVLRRVRGVQARVAEITGSAGGHKTDALEE